MSTDQPEKTHVTVLTEECASCGEGITNGECSDSRRPCGHHCNHVWTHDGCDWCGAEFLGDGVVVYRPAGGEDRG